jgi:hypothetical protein
LGCTARQRNIPVGYLLQLLVQRHHGSLLFLFFQVSSVSTRGAEGQGDCGPDVIIVEEADGVGEKWSGNTTTVTVETLLEAFLKGFQTWDSFPQLLQYQDFWSISIRIKEIILYFTNCSILISTQHMYFKAL